MLTPVRQSHAWRRVVAMAACAHVAISAGAQTVGVVEYYNASQDHYFVSSLPADISALDSGQFKGWTRTGRMFEAYPTPSGAASPVCRFYIPPALGDSHFYSASPTECGQTAAKFPAFVEESTNVMYIDLPNPVTGACPAGDAPVYRVWDNRVDSNHRYTTDAAVRAQMVAHGWVAEGYGPNLVIMCAPPSPRPAGIYVDSTELPLSPANAATLAASLTVRGVDGLVLVLGWDQLEPAMGQFAWSVLDTWMAMAANAGIRVELSVRADTPPAWLFQPAPGGAGATPLHFTYSGQDGTRPCRSETIAAPWDLAFLNQWDAMLAALAAHLQGTGTYGTVSLLRLTGINRDSDELHLPQQTPQSAGNACVSDAVATWLQAGYRPSKLLQGWDGTTSAFKRNFPDKFFSVAIIASTYPFPPIAEDGSVITSTQGLGATQNLPLLTLASQKFPGQLVIQNNSLYPDEPAQSQTVQAAQSLGTLIAFQTNLDFGGPSGGAGCGSRGDATPTPCTAATFLQMLETGIYPLGKSNGLRAQYIEVFAANVNAFPAATQQAHAELIP
jgi:hypothetical protein